MKSYTKQEIIEIANRVDQYFQSRDYKSFDLCDIKAKPFFLHWDKLFFGKAYGKYALFPVNSLVQKYPESLRKILAVKEQSFAQSHALFIRAYLLQYQRLKDNSILNIADNLMTWVIQQRSKACRYSAWGQPYEWFSQKIIPENTPRTTVTSQILHTLIDFYGITTKEKFLHMIKDICSFFMKEMPRSFDAEDELCFSYTMVDNYKVYNANMMAASALLRAGNVLSDSLIIDMGNRCLKYTMNRQNNDGSWYYYDLPDNKESKIDNYHTGYILESLAIIRSLQKNEFLYDSHFALGNDFYTDHFFLDGVVPKMTPLNIYPIDIQCCAQSIITLLRLSEHNERYFEQAERILHWTLENFYSNKGYFFYRINKRGGTKKISYIRWGDAWMYFAIQKYLKQIDHE